MPYENVTIYVVWGSAKETKPITVVEPAEDVKVEDTIKVPDTFYSETLLIVLIIVSLLFISIKITKKTS